MLQVATNPINAFSRHETIETITIPTLGTQYGLTSNGGKLPNDRYMHGIFLECSFRVATPAANGPTVVNADAPYSFVNEVIVEGKHKLRRATETIVRMRGPAIAEWQKLYTKVAPVSSGTLGVTASTNYDITFVLYIPFTAIGSRPQDAVNYILDTPNYEQLTLTIRIGDEKNLYTVGSTASTFSAYGSASGSPTVKVSGLFCLESKGKFAGFLPGLLSRYYWDAKTSSLVTTNNGVRLVDVPRGGKIRAIMFKTGVKASTNAGNVAYLSLSDSIAQNVKLYSGLNRPLWDFGNMRVLRQHAILSRSIAPSTGYGLIDFVSLGNLQESLNLEAAIAGSTGDIDTYIGADITGAASQDAEFTFEELVVKPGLLQRRR